jgi:hypothetical protein
LVFMPKNQDFPGLVASLGCGAWGGSEGNRGELSAKTARTRVAEAACGAGLGDDAAASSGHGRDNPEI